MQAEYDVKIRGEQMRLLVRAYAHGGGVRLDLMSDEGPYAHLSVNLDGEAALEAGEFLVRLGGVFDGMLEELVAQGVLEDCGTTIHFGFEATCAARVCRLVAVGG